MHLTTRALVLREVNYKESDKILTILAEDGGKMTVTARGCRKKNSPFAAACQLLVWSEFTLYEYQGRWAVREAETELLFRGVRQDLDKLSLASYFAEVTETVVGEGQPEPEILALLLNSLYVLEQKSLPLTQVKTVFEWKIMALAGYAPACGACGVCGNPDPEEPWISLREGVVCCDACRPRLEDGTALPLSRAALSALRHIVEGNPRRIFSFRTDDPSLRKLEQAGEAYLILQTEREFRTLDFWKTVAEGRSI